MITKGFLEIGCILEDESPAPAYQTPGSAGLDLHAAADFVVEPKDVTVVGTGLCMELPPGYEAQVRSRSGLAAKSKIFVLNSPGTIDSDYRDEVKVILANFSDKPFSGKRGDRIAQLVVSKYEKIMWTEKKTLSETKRKGGLGHTDARKECEK